MTANLEHTTHFKRLTADKFSKAALQYQEFALVQQQSADYLISQISPRSNAICLDLGAGPGVNSRALKKLFTRVIALDLSAHMLAQIPASLVDFKCCADMDALPFQPNSFDAVFSNFASQWSQDFATLLSQLHQTLKPGGRVYLTNVLAGSLAEIAQAWQAIDNQKHINSFLSYDEFKDIADHSSFKVIELHSKLHQQGFATALEAFKSIKAIGANTKMAHQPTGLLGKKAFQTVLSAYPHQQGEFYVSYYVGYMVLEK
ncbi:methyltransferase domain-containing protein [Pseudoalteromonas tunicata]|uniref:methyltransferase domain-containing protein n=1 Tax=Pseudoalteromonas tunicata TaxID=314281 RepID=UPI00273CF937|nr:methyltransferase domain-containing protein [Pseudoalteromonas tunicata]MDP4984462.1 methyltransferase domain-containing protein [Pseudoalteromonas tunicata]